MAPTGATITAHNKGDGDDNDDEAEENHGGAPIDRGWAWCIVAGCWLVTYLLGGLLRSAGILLKELAIYFDAPASVVFVTLAVQGLLYAFITPFGVEFGRRFGRRRMVMFGGVLGCAGMALSSLAFNIEYIICTYFVCFGISNGLVVVNAISVLNVYFDKRRALASGIAWSGGSIGVLTLPIILQLLLEEYSIKGTILICSALYLNIAVCGALLRPVSFYTKHSERNHGQTKRLSDVVEGDNYREETENLNRPTDVSVAVDSIKDRSPEVEEASNKHSAHLIDNNQNSPSQVSKLVKYASVEVALSASVISLDRVGKGVKEKPTKKFILRNIVEICNCRNAYRMSLFRNYEFAFYTLCTVFSLGTVFNILYFIPIHTNLSGENEYKVAALISINGAFDLAGRLWSGYFSNLKLISALKLQAICLLLSGFNTLVLPWANVYWWIAIHCAIYGFLFGACIPLANLIPIDLVGIDLFPQAFSLMFFFVFIMISASQPLLGWVKDVTGATHVTFTMIAVSSIIASAILLFFYPKVKRMEQERKAKLEDWAAQQREDNLIHDKPIVKSTSDA